MISGKIIGKRRSGLQVFVQYALTDNTDGEFNVSIGTTVDVINSQLQTIVDAANYAESLASLIGSVVISTTVNPDPVKQKPQFIADQATLKAGTSVDLSVNLINGGKVISGFQVDIVLPSGFTLSKAIAGKASTDAGKTLSLNANRLLIAGLNQTTLADGEVLVLTIAADPATLAGPYLFSFANGASTDAGGNSVPALYVGNTLKVG